MRPPQTRSMRVGWLLIAPGTATLVLVVVAFRR
jgi:hypothetical protein